MKDFVTVREHEPLEIGRQITKDDAADLKAFVGKAFTLRNDSLIASKYVGIITTKRGLVVEILPKIDLGGGRDADHETTRRTFLQMLRRWRGWRKRPHKWPVGDIRATSRLPMHEVFFALFLANLNALARAGLARRYVPLEENLPYLRGRLLFREHSRENRINHARFFVAHDPLSVNRPANRLIHTALTKLRRLVRTSANRQLLRELSAVFEDVPLSADTHADWREHYVDRSMQHYEPVMQWVGLFLFNHGLSTFSGRHTNLSLLFPMEEVFEDFVTHSFGRHQENYEMVAQPQREYLAKINGDHAFRMKPDIALRDRGRDVFILDAKWKKDITASGDAPKHGIHQSDLYQLYAHGKSYGCKAVALVYPQTKEFSRLLRYKFFDDLPLLCLPFDVTRPQCSVESAVEKLRQSLSVASPSDVASG